MKNGWFKQFNDWATYDKLTGISLVAIAIYFLIEVVRSWAL